MALSYISFCSVVTPVKNTVEPASESWCWYGGPQDPGDGMSRSARPQISLSRQIEEGEQFECLRR
jgi:hypothetical protein